MKSYIKCYILGLLILSASSMELAAQDSNTVPEDKIAVITLKDGSKIEGEILDWQIDEYIMIKLAWGGQTRIDQHKIKKIIQKSTLQKYDKVYNFKEEGFYYAGRINVISGNDGNRANGVFGLGASVSSGYKFNRFLSLGAGVGYDKFIWDSGENLLPVFAEVSGYLNQTNTSLFYNIQTGYSFAFKDNDYLLVDAKGGFMIFPSLGVRWNNAGSHSMTLSVGYKFQNAEFTYRNQWNANERFEHDVLFKRLTVSLGILI